MDVSSVLWTNWHEQLKELLTGIHGHQKKTLALFVLGIVLSGSAVMQRVAETLSERGLSEAKMTSIERRLARFIANERIVVPLIWKLFLEQVLTPFRGQQLYFVLDNTPFRDDLTIVYLGLLVHSRVLPVAWAVMPAQTKWDEGQWDIVGRGARPGACASARHIVYPPRRSWISRYALGQALHRSWVALSVTGVCRAYAGARFFHGKLEQSWKRFDHIVRHRAAIAGMEEPESGKKKRWTPTSAWSGTQTVRSRGCSSAIREQDGDRCRSMRGACAWKRPSKIAKAAAGTSKPVGL